MNSVKHLKKHWLFWLIIFVLTAGYFAIRIPNLTFQPIFADEAIYVRWAEVAKAEPTLRFISLQDGKTPLFMWLMAPFLILYEDPLFAGRLLSVISGYFTLLGVFWIGKNYFSLRTGLIAAFLVAITPFMIFFDRMALVDSMLSAFTVWSIFWALKLADEQNLKNMIILGLLLAGGWLTKTPGMINIALLPLMGFFFDFKHPDLKKRLIHFGKYFFGAASIAVVLYAFQIIDPNFRQLSSRNSDYLHPVSRLLVSPFDPFYSHLKDTFYFGLSYLGSLLLLLPLILGVVLVKRKKVAIILLLWALIPICYELQFIKAFTARYILYCIPLILILSAYVLDLGLSQTKKNLGVVHYATILFLFITFGLMVRFVYPLHTNLAEIPLATAERSGYLEDWTAGYGMKEIANYLIRESQTETIIVGTEGTFGTLPDGLVIYLDNYFHSTEQQKIIIVGGKGEVSNTLRDFSSEKPTYFVTNKSRYPVAGPALELIKEYPKVVGTTLPADSILFYKVLPLEQEADHQMYN